MQQRSSSSVRVFYPRYSRGELIGLLQQRAAALALQLPLKRAVLFGSWARDKATAFSDVDVLVVYAGPVRSDAYTIIWDAMHVRGLELHAYAEDEAEAIAPVIERMTRDGVDLLRT